MRIILHPRKTHGAKSFLPVIACAILVLISSLKVYAKSSDTDSQPPPAKLCFDMNFEEQGAVRAEPGVYRNELNCRLLVVNGDYRTLFNPGTGERTDYTSPANIGQRAVLNQGVRQAVDVFSPAGTTHFETGVVVCLRGHHQLLFSSAMEMPRSTREVSVFQVRAWNGFTCTTITEPGLIVMINRQVELAPPPIHLDQCTVTTNYTMHLRSQANSDSDSLLLVPYNVSMPSSARSGSWLYVEYENQLGWLSGAGNLLSFEGECGLICEQNAAGTSLRCRPASPEEMGN